MELVGVSSAVDPNAPVYKTPDDDGGKDMFLQLLVTQLQNQDPLDPMDNTEFVAQLAQFSQLESLANLDQSMTGMAESITSMQNFSSASLLGRGVKLDGNGMYYAGTPVIFGYELVEGADHIDIKIYDSNNRLVKSTQKGGAGRGEYDFTWDGTDNNGIQLKEGLYNFDVRAYDPEGLPLEVKSHMVGVVDSVAFKDGGVTVMAGGTATSMDKIKEIY
ncbi:MAG: flagellar hook assembly protein FlgD [Proteobacteria bacterium]|nr:flagellar hook assembly protein FlgD [Pseudomonadota bacterium]